MDSGGLTLRQAEEGDAKAIYAVHTASIRGLCSSSYDGDAIDCWAGRQAPERYVPFIKEGEITVAVENGQVIGFGHLLNGEEVKGLFVSPDCGRKGVGSALLRRLEEQARRAGSETVRLKASLNAVGFYQGQGFSVVDSSEKCTHCEEGIRCVLMTKSLGQA